MLTIRFSRVGKKGQPTFRLVIMEKARDPWGRALEMLGWYNPRTKEKSLKSERIRHWIGKGAQASDSVHNFLVSAGVVQGKKRAVSRISKKRAERLKAGIQVAAPEKNEETSA